LSDAFRVTRAFVWGTPRAWAKTSYSTFSPSLCSWCGTWIGVVAGVAFVQCPAQDETCGDRAGVVGDVGTQLAVVLGITFVVLVVWWRWKVSRRETGHR
jgi:hypothetical protein